MAEQAAWAIHSAGLRWKRGPLEVLRSDPIPATGVGVAVWTDPPPFAAEEAYRWCEVRRLRLL
eukprot:5013064-Lingulodinium_polyedra.AAC.1